MNRKWYVVLGSLVVLAVVWSVFRPELLFVNARVHEEFPASGGAAEARALAQGEFHGRPPATGIPRAGSVPDLVVPDDFKAPLDELREYME